MTVILDLLHNQVLMCAVAAWLLAQIMKTVIHLRFTKQFVAERLIGSGGMPSSHSAAVMSMATAAGFTYGLSSFEFAIALIMGLVVMYDAMGVRRETGIQARVLNELMDVFGRTASMDPEDRLKEFVGHTPLQVVVGALLGIAVAVLMCIFVYHL